MPDWEGMIGELVRTWTDDRRIMGEFGVTNAVHLKYKGKAGCRLVSGRKETVIPPNDLLSF